MEPHNFVIDTVKEEKANAIARYRRFRKFKKLLQIFEVFVALTLLSWSSTCLPSVVKFSGEFLVRASLYILNPHVVFLIGNLIVVALYVLSRHFDSGNDSDGANFHEMSEDQNSTAEVESLDSLDSQFPATDEINVGESEKQIICVENVVKRTECEAVVTAIEKATKQIRRFERTQSEKLKRDISLKYPRELRRSETEVRRTVITSGDRLAITSTDTFEKVDSLSNEEFRLTVEAFIEKQQKFIRQQKMAEIQTKI